jgi:hypothetical protein
MQSALEAASFSSIARYLGCLGSLAFYRLPRRSFSDRLDRLGPEVDGTLRKPFDRRGSHNQA